MSTNERLINSEGNSTSKRLVAQVMTGASLTLCGAHLYILRLLAGTFAAGLVWWASVMLLIGPIVAFTALIISIRSPRQPVAASLNGLLILIYLGVWAPIIPRLTFQ